MAGVFVLLIGNSDDQTIFATRKDKPLATLIGWRRIEFFSQPMNMHSNRCISREIHAGGSTKHD